MKKLLIALLALTSLYVIYKINNEKIKPVSINTLTNFSMEDYNVFYLDLSESNITTKNIGKYFKNVDIISIIPYVNPIYKDKIDLKYNFVNNVSLRKNINDFINYYKNSIKNKGYLDNLDYIDIDGIKINEISVYGKGIEIYKIIYDNNIKYKTVFNGIYEYLEV